MGRGGRREWWPYGIGRWPSRSRPGARPFRVRCGVACAPPGRPWSVHRRPGPGLGGLGLSPGPAHRLGCRARFSPRLGRRARRSGGWAEAEHWHADASSLDVAPPAPLRAGCRSQSRVRSAGSGPGSGPSWQPPPSRRPSPSRPAGEPSPDSEGAAMSNFKRPPSHWQCRQRRRLQVASLVPVRAAAITQTSLNDF